MLAAFVHAVRHQLRSTDPAADMARLLALAEAGRERIAASTPIPFPYSLIIHRTVYFYCVLLPFGQADAIGPMTPVIVAFIA